MQEPNLKKAINLYLKSAKMMQLTTSSPDGHPWICNVWFAADKDMNIYWISSTNRRHSIEIANNPHVAASICLVNQPSESDYGALQIEGTAEKLTSPLEIAKALKLYASRGIFSVKQVNEFMADLEYPHRFYRVKPKTICLFKNGKQTYRL